MTEIGGVGEFNLIARLAAGVGTPASPEGPGDDAALVRAPDGQLVVTTDLLIEGTHFRRDWSTAYDIGRKAAAQNLADVAAMGARPTVLLIGLGAPADLPVADFDAFAEGIRAECAVAGAALVGGDLVKSPHLVVSGTAMGVLDGRPPVLRSGARAGDLIGVIGRLGWAAAGLRLLTSGENAGELVDAQRRPEPPYAAGPELAIAGATAMCDVSDGLLSDLGQLCAASDVRIDIELAPLQALGTTGVTAEELLTGGEDHALAFAIPAGARLPAGAVVIGRVSEGGGVYVDGQTASAGGYDHFATAAQ